MKKKLSNPCTIYLVRHGETDYNLEFRVEITGFDPVNSAW